MKFLLDTNTCSAYMRRPGKLAHRFLQFADQLAIPTIVLAELYAGAYKHPDPTRLLALIDDLVSEMTMLDFNSECAEEFGRVRGQLLQQGVSVSTVDLFIAAVALAHDLTLVTHDIKDFQNVPDLQLVDWLES